MSATSRVHCMRGTCLALRSALRELGCVGTIVAHAIDVCCAVSCMCDVVVCVRVALSSSAHLATTPKSTRLFIAGLERFRRRNTPPPAANPFTAAYHTFSARPLLGRAHCNQDHHCTVTTAHLVRPDRQPDDVSQRPSSRETLDLRLARSTCPHFHYCHMSRVCSTTSAHTNRTMRSSPLARIPFP